MDVSDMKRIVLQMTSLMLDDRQISGEIVRDHMIVIESVRPLLSPECYVAALSTVRATAYSVDASTDRLRQFVAELERL